MTLARDYTMQEVADALGMSERWVRLQVKEGAEHLRLGHKIRFTLAQVEKLRTDHTRTSVPQSLTTGRKKRPA